MQLYYNSTLKIWHSLHEGTYMTLYMWVYSQGACIIIVLVSHSHPMDKSVRINHALFGDILL